MMEMLSPTSTKYNVLTCSEIPPQKICRWLLT